MTAERPGSPAGPADRIDLIDKDDRRRYLASLREQLTNSARADPHNHLDKLGCARAEERNFCFSRRGSGQQRLTGSRRSGYQHTLGSTCSKPFVLLGVSQEINDFIDLRFYFIDAGDIFEGDTNGFAIDGLFRGAPKQPSAHRGLLALEHPQVKADQQQERSHRHEQIRQESSLPHQRRCPHSGLALRQFF